MSTFEQDPYNLFSKSNLLEPGYALVRATKDVCRLSCHTFEYPTVEYVEDKVSRMSRVAPSGRTCAICDTSKGCTRCAGPKLTDCTECKQNMFLEVIDQKAQTGQCRQKDQTPTLPAEDIFVSNRIDEEVEPARQRAGTLYDPLATLTDAFIRARDIAGPYQHEKLITIHLFQGDHYILENRFDTMNIYYQKESIDNFALNINLQIKPLMCNLDLNGLVKFVPGGPENVGELYPAICIKKLNETVRVFNKIRERFSFPVMNMMSLDRIIVDGADSILPYGTPCLS